MTDHEKVRIDQDGDRNVIGAISVGGTANQSGTIDVGTVERSSRPARTASAGQEEVIEEELPAEVGLMPPYRAVLVVDVAGFSRLSSAHQSEIGAAIVPVLEGAFERAGLADAWSQRRFRPRAHTGDGYIVGLRPETLPRLLHPFLRELQQVLRSRDVGRLAGRPRMRLRASIHVGPLPDTGRDSDGVGKPMTETHRLLDSAQARRALEDSDPAVTFLAAIVSSRVFEDVVEAGYTALRPTQFEEVVAESKGGFNQRAYLHVPAPSLWAG